MGEGTSTRRTDWMQTLYWNAHAVFRRGPTARPVVWIDVPGPDGRRLARFDFGVAFGPRAEGELPQVLVEIASAEGRFDTMRRKFELCERGGVEELVILYPDDPVGVEAWQRVGPRLELAASGEEYTSPRLGFRFAQVGFDLVAFGADGQRLPTPVEMILESNRLRAAREAAVRPLGVDPGIIPSGVDTPSGGSGR